jgi:hypothetical protein
MRSIVLGMLVVLGAFTAPAPALAQPPQQSADDYQLRLLVWQQLVEREVNMMAAVLLDDSKWPDVATRLDWAQALGDVVSVVTRPAPGWERVYQLQVQPMNDRLSGLAAALRVDRRDSAVSMLAALRSTLSVAPPGPAATDASPSGTGFLAAPPASGQAAVDAAVSATQASCLARAYVLGWRWESPLTAEEFLRQYWTQWLAQSGADVSIATRGDLSCDDLYQQVQQIVGDRGFEVAQGGGVVASTRPNLVPAQTDRGLALRRYRLLAGSAKRWLPDSMTCFLRTIRPNLTSLRVDGTDCETVVDQLTADSAASGAAAGPDPCAANIAAFRLCLVSLWRDTYRDASRWTPPPEYASFHTDFLGVLTLLSQAADNIQYVDSYQPPTGGQPLTAAARLRYFREARNLVVTAQDQYEQTVGSYDLPLVGGER